MVCISFHFRFLIFPISSFYQSEEPCNKDLGALKHRGEIIKAFALVGWGRMAVFGLAHLLTMCKKGKNSATTKLMYEWREWLHRVINTFTSSLTPPFNLQLVTYIFALFSNFCALLCFCCCTGSSWVLMVLKMGSRLCRCDNVGWLKTGMEKWSPRICLAWESIWYSSGLALEFRSSSKDSIIL